MVTDTLLDLMPKIRGMGDREAFLFCDRFRNRKVSYSELDKAIGGCARLLGQRGLVKGNRIVLWGENRPEWAAAFWGSICCGIQVVPLDEGFSPRLVERICRQTEAKLLFYSRRTAAAGLPPGDSYPLEALWETELTPVKPVRASPDDIVEIVFTSGTTGDPKGVIHRHNNLCTNLRPFASEFEKYRWLAAPFQPIRLLNLLPLSHMFGQSLSLFIPPLLGGSCVLQSSLEPEFVVETIRSRNISVLITVPRILAQLETYLRRTVAIPDRLVTRTGIVGVAAKWWRFRDLHARLGPKFWAVIVGGAPLRPSLEDFWLNVGILPVQGYGMTEASPVVAVNHPFKSRKASLGQILPGQDTRISEDGEIMIRGGNVATEYAADNQVLSTLDNDGWFRTGDMGEIDSDGYLIYKGRKKEVIVTSEGLNVFPEDVEEPLNRSPGVSDVAVIGLEQDGEETVHAVLILDDKTVDVDELIGATNRQLEAHQRILSWSLWPEETFPRTPSTFKLRRKEIQLQTARKGTQASSSFSEATVPSRFERILRMGMGTQPDSVKDSDHLSRDLGLTSLDRVELLTELETSAGRRLSEFEFAQIETVSQLKEWLSEKSGPKDESRVQTAAVSSGPRLTRTFEKWTTRIPFSVLRNLLQNTLILPLFRRYYPLRVRGLENLSKLTAPVVFAANHTSHFDTVALLAALPFDWRRRISPAIRQEYFGAILAPERYGLRERFDAWTQYLLSCFLFNTFWIPQKGGAVREVIQHSGWLADRGFCPLIYPEGRRSPDGRIHQFQSGVGLLSTRIEVPVVPVYIGGLFDLFPAHRRWPKGGPVSISFGPAIQTYKAWDQRDLIREIEAGVRRAEPTHSSSSAPGAST